MMNILIININVNVEMILMIITTNIMMIGYLIDFFKTFFLHNKTFFSQLKSIHSGIASLPAVHVVLADELHHCTGTGHFGRVFCLLLLGFQQAEGHSDLCCGWVVLQGREVGWLFIIIYYYF